MPKEKKGNRINVVSYLTKEDYDRLEARIKSENNHSPYANVTISSFIRVCILKELNG